MPATPTFTPIVGKPYRDARGTLPWTVTVQSGSTGGIVEHKRFPTQEDAQAFADLGGHTPPSGRRAVMTLVADGRNDHGYQSGYSKGAR